MTQQAGQEHQPEHPPYPPLLSLIKSAEVRTRQCVEERGWSESGAQPSHLRSLTQIEQNRHTLARHRSAPFRCGCPALARTREHNRGRIYLAALAASVQ